jgi:DNA (cytosine-5)-methyltransferase 1
MTEVTGFHFVWGQSNVSTLTQQFRQIGNAVPVPFATALGRAIGKAAVQTWRDEDKEHMRVDSPEL